MVLLSITERCILFELNGENIKKKKNSSQHSVRHAHGMNWKEEKKNCKTKQMCRPTRWLMPYQFSQHFMNNVIDYSYILLCDATTKVKDLNLTVSCTWRWYTDQRSHTHTHTHTHTFDLVTCFAVCFFIFCSDWLSKWALYAHTRMHKIASISTFMQCI